MSRVWPPRHEGARKGLRQFQSLLIFLSSNKPRYIQHSELLLELLFVDWSRIRRLLR